MYKTMPSRQDPMKTTEKLSQFSIDVGVSGLMAMYEHNRAFPQNETAGIHVFINSQHRNPVLNG